MKNLKILLGITLIAVIIFASCGDPEPEDETFLVQFLDSNNASLGIDSQHVISGGNATEPSTPTKSGAIPSNEGLYTAPFTSNFAGWQLDGEDFDFYTPITAHITLKAKWTESSPIAAVASATGTNIVAKAFSYLNASGTTAGDFILALGADVTCTTQKTEKTNTKLTIVGIGSERTITLSGAAPLFAIGKANTGSASTPNAKDNTISFTLGNNITLQGTASSTESLVWIRNGTKFTMKPGSKITGNTSSGDTYGKGWGSALHIDWSFFIMEGGSVAGNNGSKTADGHVVGGVYIEDSSTVTLEGGSISGNTSVATQDLYIVGGSTLTMSGTANVKDLTLGIGYNSSQQPVAWAFVTVSSDFTGSVESLNLRGAASDWTPANRPLLKAATGTLTAATIEKFTLALGNFINDSTAAKTPITDTHKISSTGALVVK